MTTLRFDVPGDAVGKGRARATKQGAHIRLYTPAKTVGYESLIALFAAQAMAGRQLFAGPVALDLTIAVAIPASWSKKRTARAHVNLERPTKKPDLDNILKAFGDALNGVVWKDDVQVVTMSARKFFDAAPMVGVLVTSLEQ